MPTSVGMTVATVSSVVPTLDGPVLVTLAGLDAPASGRRIHQLCRTGSEAGVRKVLTRLVRTGLVRADPVGGALLYAPNRDHVAWPVVTALAALPDMLISRLRSEIGRWATRPRAAALVGSASGTENRAENGVELLVVRRRRIGVDDPSWQGQLGGLRRDLTAWTGTAGRIHDLGLAELKARVTARDDVVDEWRRDAISVAGKDVRELLRDLGHRKRA